jgi:hypothetical protein
VKASKDGRAKSHQTTRKGEYPRDHEKIRYQEGEIQIMLAE